MSSKRSGYVAIVGRPNVGKSTLLNYLAGCKLAGVSAKPQTTRGVVRGIVTRPEGQIIFVDTPGHHQPADELGNWMLGQIAKTVSDVDLVYWMVAPRLPKDQDKKIGELLKSNKCPVILVVNQIDRFEKSKILTAIHAYQELLEFKEFIPISAKTGKQVDVLVKETVKNLPKGEYLFPEDQISDQQERYFIQEIIREKVFRSTGQEIPYSCSVGIESFKEREDGMTEIHATITVERRSQQGIVIGKKGSKLKQIGKASRLEIEKFLGNRVFLKLKVKTEADWKKKKGVLKKMGYE